MDRQAALPSSVFALLEGVFFDGPVLDAPLTTLVCVLVESKRWVAPL